MIAESSEVPRFCGIFGRASRVPGRFRQALLRRLAALTPSPAQSHWRTTMRRARHGAMGNVIGIAAGTYHSLALKGDGTVVAWGYNLYGQTSVPAGTQSPKCSTSTSYIASISRMSVRYFVNFTT